MASRQRMTNEYGITAVSIQGAIGLIDERVLLEHFSRLEKQRLIENRGFGFDNAHARL